MTGGHRTPAIRADLRREDAQYIALFEAMLPHRSCGRDLEPERLPVMADYRQRARFWPLGLAHTITPIATAVSRN